MKPVALVSMPTLSGRYPSFQLGLLKPTLERAGVPAQAFSLYMYFGTFVGWRLHEALSEVWPSMVGEWLWARAAFGGFADDEAYFKTFERNFETIGRMGGCTIDDVRRVRDEVVPEFLDFCVNSVDWSRFGLIGFTVLFQQNLASIAFARALKKRWPDIPIIMGGGTFEDDIAEEFLRHVPEIDMIHCGDADTTFIEIARRIGRGERLDGVPGVMWRDRAAGGRIVYAGRAPNHLDMSSTPVPDFDEYFYAREQGGYAAWPEAESPMIPIETARGCWWGEASHCTFCGLNRAGMEFRSKDVPSVIDMLESLARRYGTFNFNAIDNIMAPEYIEKLFGALAEAGTDLRLHYEIRTNIRREQLRRMQLGGLISVQPGVESLSTHVLELMAKGTSGMMNLELIKWCTYLGITNLYNILVGFPGETEEDYKAQCEVVARIPHLQAPYAIVRARPDRGSPMFTDPAGHSITSLKPERCYPFLYPTQFDLSRVSYYFEHDQTGILSDAQYDPIFALVHGWQERWKEAEKPFLRYKKSWNTIVIEDGRWSPARALQYSDAPARIYEICADAHRLDKIVAAAAAFGASRAEVEEALADFVARDLMVFLDGRYLSLALPANPWFGMAPARAKAAEKEKPAASPAPAPAAHSPVAGPPPALRALPVVG